MQNTAIHPEAQTQPGTRGESGTRRALIPLIAALVGAGILVGLLARAGVLPSAAAETTEAPAATIAAVTRGDIVPSTSATGQIEPVGTARLAPAGTGRVADVPVRAGDSVAAGDLLVQLDTTDLALAVERAQQHLALQEAGLAALREPAPAADLAAAEAGVASALAQLEALLAGPDAGALAEAAANVRIQQAGVASAAAAYHGVRDAVSATALAAAEADVVSAQIAYDNARQVNATFANSATHEAMLDAQQALEIAQAALDELRAGPTPGTLDSAAYAISAASAGVDQAQASYDLAAAGATPAQIAAAQATLASAEAALADLQRPATATDLAAAEATVTQARLALADAEDALAGAAITAPFAGIVTAIDVAPGELASGPVVTVALAEMQLILAVAEIDIGAITPGGTASVTLEAWPDVALEAMVRSIAPAPEAAGSAAGVVSYDVTLVLEATDLPLRAGMTASAQLYTAGRQDVLRVPNAAITADRASGTYMVQRVTGSSDDAPLTETVVVTVGLRDASNTEITGGLAKGDQVIVDQLTAPAQGYSPGDGTFLRNSQ